MEQERGLSPTTVALYCAQVGQFLRWYGSRSDSLSSLQVSDVDAFLAYCGTRGWSRVTIKNAAGSLRAFLRRCASNGLCKPTLADAVSAPRLYTHENLPAGPSWPDVQRLLESLKTNNPGHIRDRAILMLFAIYALRASEVSQLRLEDIDWEHDLIRIHRSKRRGTQLYPLMPVVGNAIARYLREIRPPSAHQFLFLTLLAPFRPVSRRVLYALTSCHMRALGIQSAHLGPHALRHACAAHLLSQGFSLKEIGDHLGHRSTSATHIYAKVDLTGLREVAAFDLGGVL
jgi:site-specific recombinase XerD